MPHHGANVLYLKGNKEHIIKKDQNEVLSWLCIRNLLSVNSTFPSISQKSLDQKTNMAKLLLGLNSTLLLMFTSFENSPWQQWQIMLSDWLKFKYIHCRNHLCGWNCYIIWLFLELPSPKWYFCGSEIQDGCHQRRMTRKWINNFFSQLLQTWLNINCTLIMIGWSVAKITLSGVDWTWSPLQKKKSF